MAKRRGRTITSRVTGQPLDVEMIVRKFRYTGAPAPRRTPEEVAEERERLGPAELDELEIGLFSDTFDEFYRTVDKKVDHASKQVIQTAAREASLQVYNEYGQKNVFWVSVADGNSCNDCLKMHGATMGLDEWRARYGKTRCNGNCRCQPLAVDPNDLRDIEPLENVKDMRNLSVEERAARWAGVHEEGPRRQ